MARPCSIACRLSSVALPNERVVSVSIHLQAGSILIDIEAQLRQLQQWQPTRPADSALASTQPFCIDTLTFPQWLQFIFIERMQALVELRLPLPRDCSIAPMAEEYFLAAGLRADELIALLREMDALLCDQC